MTKVVLGLAMGALSGFGLLVAVLLMLALLLRLGHPLSVDLAVKSKEVVH